MKKTAFFIICTLFLFCCSCAKGGSDHLASQTPSATPAAAVNTPIAEPAAITERPTPESPLPVGTPSPEEMQPESHAAEHNLVCIGDSIASGFALPPIGAQRYSTLLCDMLSSDSEHWNEYNYAVPGHTSSDLVSLLDKGLAAELSGADIVTVCIGANNVLMPAQTFLMKYGSYAFGIESGVDSGLTASDIRDAYDNFRNASAAGAETLRRDLSTVMEHIRAVNADARVIFMTVYNPYKTNETEIDIAGLPIPMNIMSDTFVTMINDVITDEAASLGYETADVYSAFETTEEYLVNGDGADSFLADPHPNTLGHEIIAETYYSVISAAS